jgi:putative DNA primase/helicase
MVLIPNGRAPWTCDVGTIIKAAKTAGFALGPAKVLATASASSFISYGPFTMDPIDGLTKLVKLGRAKNSVPEPAWISPPFEVLGQCRDPQGCAWGKQIRFRDADGRVHTRHVSDAGLQGDPASLCGELAGDGLQVDRSHQRELAEYLSGVTVSERVTNVSKTGWHEIDGQHVFVLPAETIAGDLSERVMLDTAARGSYEARGSLEDWKQGIGTLTIGHALPVFMVSAALAGPLAYLVGAEVGGVNVYGQSSIGKSAMLAAGASVWGRGGAGRPVMCAHGERQRMILRAWRQARLTPVWFLMSSASAIPER